MLSVLRRLRERRTRIVDGAGLADFLAAQAAFVSQRATLDYCRARAGVAWPQLFRASEFGQALELCRLEAYAAVLGDVGEVALIFLRQSGGTDDARLADAVADGLGRALRRQGMPPQRSSWDDVLDAHAARLRRAMLAA